MMKKTLLLSFILGLIAFTGFAQVQDFLPENRSSIGYKGSSFNYSKVYADGGKRSVLDLELENNSLEAGDVLGVIKYSKNVHRIDVQYGLLDTLNVVLSLPYIQRKRTSQLSDSDASHTTFIENHASVDTSGMGDISLGVIWRTVYTDVHNFQIGFEYTGDNGVYQYGESDKLSLGSGTKDLTGKLKWYLYPLGTSLRVNLEMASTYSLKGKVKDSNGDEFDIERDASQTAQLGVFGSLSPFHYVASVNYISRSASVINEESQGDGVKGVYVNAAVGITNLSQLEQGPVALPWEIELGVRYNYSGNDLPVGYALALNGRIYF